LEALGFDIKLRKNICAPEEQPSPNCQPRITHMTSLSSGHKCISIEEVDPEGWDATAEGEEFDAQFRASRSAREKKDVLS